MRINSIILKKKNSAFLKLIPTYYSYTLINGLLSVFYLIITVRVTIENISTY